MPESESKSIHPDRIITDLTDAQNKELFCSTAPPRIMDANRDGFLETDNLIEECMSDSHRSNNHAAANKSGRFGQRISPMLSVLRRVARRLLTRAIGYDFFISYSRGQKSPTQAGDLPKGKAQCYAIELERRLTQAGFTCFRDDTESAAGLPIESILCDVDTSRAIIAIGSKEADTYVLKNKRYDGWVKKEVVRFQERRPSRRRVLRLMHFFFTAFKDMPFPFREKSSKTSRILLVAFSWKEEKPDFADLSKRLGVVSEMIGIEDSHGNLLAGMPSDAVIDAIKKHVDWFRVGLIGKWVTAISATVLLVVSVGLQLSRIRSDAIDFVTNKIERTAFQEEDLKLLAQSIRGPLFRTFVRDHLRTRFAENPSASGRATNGAVLVSLHDTDIVWDALRYQNPDHERRTYLAQRFATGSLSPEELFSKLKRLLDEPQLPEAGVRQSLILYFGRFDDDVILQAPMPHKFGDSRFAPKNKSLPTDLKTTITDRLKVAYLCDPDVGVHSAIEWCLSRWDEQDFRKFLDDQNTKTVLSQKRSESEVMRLRAGGSPFNWFVTTSGHTMTLIPQGDNADPHFAIATHELTVRHFGRYLEATGNKRYWADENRPKNDAAGLDRPATYVAPSDAADYCSWLSKQEGKSDLLFRLPTAPEWQASCRAATHTTRFWGDCDNLLNEFAWHSLNADFEFDDRVPGKCGRLMPNQFGLFDIFGNAAELCGAHSSGPWLSCGGSAQDIGSGMRSDAIVEEAAVRGPNVGFRIAKDVVTQTKD